MIELSTAFALTIAQGQAPAGALRTLMQAWPQDAWRADLGSPDPITAAITWRPASGRDWLPGERLDWANLVGEMIDRHAHPSVQQAQVWLLNAVQAGINQPLAQALLVRLPHRDGLPETVRAGLLARSLELSWTDLSKDLLAWRAAPDLADVNPLYNPFAKVRSLDAFDALIAAGYDPYQATADATDSIARLRARGIDSEEMPRFLSPLDRAAIMRRLTELGAQQSPRQRLDQVVRTGQRWTELQGELKALGPDAWTVRFVGGGTLLHHLALHKPRWMLNLFRWAGTQDAPESLFSTLDDAGLPAMLYRWLAPDQRSKNGNVVQDAEAWWDDMLTLPLTQRWVNALPQLAPEEPFRRFLAVTGTLNRPLPDLGLRRPSLHAEPALWRQLALVGSYRMQEGREALIHNPELQRLFDLAVWRPDASSVRRAHRLDDMMGWGYNPDLARTPLPTPWLANQFMMRTLDHYLAEGADPTTNDARFLNEVRHAFRAGACLAWAESILDQGLITFRPDATRDPRGLWNQARREHERNVLTATLNETPGSTNVPTRERSRL